MSAAVGASDLELLVDRLWRPQPDEQSPVLVTSGRLPAGSSVVEEYAVVPSRARPRFLVPVRAARAVRAAFGPFHTTDSSAARLQGQVIAAATRVPGATSALGGRLRVALPTALLDQRTELLLLSRLGQELGVGDPVAVMPVRRVTPNAKPTLRIFSRDGTPAGYAKVGWSPATRAVVANEVRALREIRGRLPSFLVPALRADGQWQGREYAVVEPLPARVRPWRVPPVDSADLLLEIAHSGHWLRAPLQGSAYVSSLRGRLRSMAESQPSEVGVLLDRLAEVESRPHSLEFGRWHGDWVPWNLGTEGGRVAAWDWEYSDPQVPVGFDLLHWHFQQALPRTGTLTGAVAALASAAEGLATLGVEPQAFQTVADLYLLEMFTRATTLASRGAGWNPRLHPAFLALNTLSAH